MAMEQLGVGCVGGGQCGGRGKREGGREGGEREERWGIRMRVKELHTQKRSKHVMYIHV